MTFLCHLWHPLKSTNKMKRTINISQRIKLFLTTIVAIYMHYDLTEIPKYCNSLYFSCQYFFENYSIDKLLFILQWTIVAVVIFSVYIWLNRKSYLNSIKLNKLQISKRMTEFKFAVLVSEMHRFEIEHGGLIFWNKMLKSKNINQSELNTIIFDFNTEAYKIILNESGESTEDANNSL